MACIGGNPEILKYLLAMPDVEVNLPGTAGKTPLDVALENSRGALVSLLAQDPRVVITPPQLRPIIATTTVTVADEEEVRKSMEEADAGLWTTMVFAACQMGHADLVALLLQKAAVDVNCRNRQGLTLLQSAARSDSLRVARMLLGRPEVDVNLRTKSTESPLYTAARAGSVQVFRLLLHDRRVKLEQGSSAVKSVVGLACEKGNEGILWELAFSSRFDLNASMVKHSVTAVPLWVVASKGQLASVKTLLAAPREIITSPPSSGGGGGGGYRIADRARETGHDAIADVIEEYEVNRGEVQRRLRNELGLGRSLAAVLYATVVMVCDGYFQLVIVSGFASGQASDGVTATGVSDSLARRFLGIVTRLPMELQMVVCNQVYGLPDESILPELREAGFTMCAL